MKRISELAEIAEQMAEAIREWNRAKHEREEWVPVAGMVPPSKYLDNARTANVLLTKAIENYEAFQSLKLPKGQHRSSWIVTKAPIRLKFEEIKLKPQNGGSHGFLEFTDIDLAVSIFGASHGFLEFTDIDLAVSIFGAWCACMDQGCIQIFDAIHKREIGYLEI